MNNYWCGQEDRKFTVLGHCSDSCLACYCLNCFLAPHVLSNEYYITDQSYAAGSISDTPHSLRPRLVQFFSVYHSGLLFPIRYSHTYPC